MGVILLAKKKEKDTTFDWTLAIKELNISEMMKAGLSYYILNNRLNPKDMNELKKIAKDYEKIPIGV